MHTQPYDMSLACNRPSPPILMQKQTKNTTVLLDERSVRILAAEWWYGSVLGCGGDGVCFLMHF